MKTDIQRIVKLTSVTSDLEAAPILSVLHSHGISARAVGGYTATFRAEAPGQVSILVDEADLARARDLLSQVPNESEQIDWSRVEVGDSSPADDTTSGGEQFQNADRRKSQGNWQVSLLTLLIIQTLFCILFAVLQDARAAYICVLLLFLLSVVAGTVLVTADPQRAKRWLRYGLLTGIAVEAFLLLSQIL